MARYVFIGSGSNLGDRLKALITAAELLAPKAQVLKASRVYKTQPWGYEDQPAFLNQVLQVETELDPPELLKHLKRIEKKMGRQATFRYGPRAIDLDILFYDDLIYSTDVLQIPHPLASERAFVLVPMREIAPDYIHPVLGKTIRELALKVDSSGIKVYEESNDGEE
jgi:2-amino-4-hydroxy-6-hydroxymethyldihydropteridine diphosphokinase